MLHSEREMGKPIGYYDDLTYGSRGTQFMEATLKIRRAERHLHELANAARELPHRRNYPFVIAPKPEPGRIRIIFMASNAMPMGIWSSRWRRRPQYSGGI